MRFTTPGKTTVRRRTGARRVSARRNEFASNRRQRTETGAGVVNVSIEDGGTQDE